MTTSVSDEVGPAICNACKWTSPHQINKKVSGLMCPNCRSVVANPLYEPPMRGARKLELAPRGTEAGRKKFSLEPGRQLTSVDLGTRTPPQRSENPLVSSGAAINPAPRVGEGGATKSSNRFEARGGMGPERGERKFVDLKDPSARMKLEPREDPAVERRWKGFRIFLGLSVAAVAYVLITGFGLFSDRGVDRDLAKNFKVKIPREFKDQNAAERTAVQLSRGAQMCLARFLAADSAGEKLKWVIDPVRIEDTVEEYYETHALEKNLDIADFGMPERLRLPDLLRGIVSLRSKSNDRMHVFFRQTPAGIKLDWETFVQVSDDRLEKFLSDPSSSPETFRVALRRSHYFGSDEVPARNFSLELNAITPTPNQATLFVDETSTVGRIIQSGLPWSEDIHERTRYATVRLRWNDLATSDLSGWFGSGKDGLAAQAISIDEVLCWELLGVGGVPPEAIVSAR